jgi:hypothetical protein
LELYFIDIRCLGFESVRSTLTTQSTYTTRSTTSRTRCYTAAVSQRSTGHHSIYLSQHPLPTYITRHHAIDVSKNEGTWLCSSSSSFTSSPTPYSQYPYPANPIYTLISIPVARPNRAYFSLASTCYTGEYHQGKQISTSYYGSRSIMWIISPQSR